MHNIRLIEYPNGSVQIRKYEQPIGTNSSTKWETDIEPFTQTTVRVVNDFSTPEESQRRSLSHTRSMIHSYARCYNWEWFCTFTYSPEKIDRYDFDLCMQKIRNWLKNQRNRYAPDLKYLAIPEPHKLPNEQGQYAFHLHILLADTGEMVFKDSGRKKRGLTIYNLSGWKYGFSSATEIKNTHAVSNYIVKYITKESLLLSKHSHRYYVSRNLPQPKETLFLVTPDEETEFLQTLINSLGVELKYSKQVTNPFVNVEYMELQ